MPGREQPVRQPEQLSAGRLPGAPPVDHRLKIAAKMAPADLSPVRPQPVVGLEPVAADDLVLLIPQQSPGDLGGAIAGDGEDRGQGGDRHPQPSLVSVLRHPVSSILTASASVTDRANS